jgi:hypothetical protein
MAGRHTRNLIRVLTAAALSMAILACAAAPIPDDLPALAVRQPLLYRMEIALLVLYGDLLLITPAFFGLIGGRLPIEISTRGAKFAEDANHAAELERTAIRKLERTTEDLVVGLSAVDVEIEKLKAEVTVGD